MAGELIAAVCVFDHKQLPNGKDHQHHVLGGFATCKSQGLDVEYLMLRGIFTVPGATKDQVDYYVDVLKKVREAPEWKD